MNWKCVVIIGLAVLLAFFLVTYFSDAPVEDKGKDEEIKKWQESYQKLADTHHQLLQTHDSLLLAIDKMDSAFAVKLKSNALHYEKIIAGFDTLSIDEHIVLLSKYLSEKDSI